MVDAGIFKAMQVMEEKNIRHIPIFDSEALLGMLSIKDVVATLMADRDTELNSMADYINVTY
ncbi:MAG: CBS domain-containing protein [Akkermansiaceae bacterium]|nr:CBS domain-containing protein [Akkermansiaceae bacterium]